MEKMSTTSIGEFNWPTASSSGNCTGISTGTGYLPNQLNINGTVGMGNTNPYQKLTVTSNKMRQVKAALFTVTRDPKTNEIIDSEFVKEFWVKQKPGVSFEVAASFANGYAIDPDKEVIRELFTVNLY
jgi:hypothetical protein